ncbi:MAG: hypothetical protein CMK59_03975 [Proteobacteria bacterium]|nr:hypothetical protein [Pseudomonadota bacterium]
MFLLSSIILSCSNSDQDTSVDSLHKADPQRGYEALVNNGYVSCGVPQSLSHLLPMGDEGDLLKGRNAQNENMPYFWTSITADSGVDLVVANCLVCHASHFNGELIVGLGDVSQDYTFDSSSLMEVALSMSSGLLETEEEREELEKFVIRGRGIAPYTQTKTAGLNPAISITAGIMEHLDPRTLKWNEDPILEVPSSYRNDVMGQSVPPWWWYKKKTKMFYSASGGGSHIAWSMLASSMCLDGEDQAAQIADYFPDILAYIKTIEAPRYPWDIDQEKATAGAEVFVQNCASCHGTYGEDWTYPEKIVELEDIGTDPVLATMMYDADVFHQWVDDSFFGEGSMATPERGYVAPPLDGIWATAPYLHNGSVPTIRALLNSQSRPQCWTWSYNTSDYNTEDLGWNHQISLCHDEVEEDQRFLIYDPSHVGYGNQGHTYGDHLSDVQRDHLLEYLKTL